MRLGCRDVTVNRDETQALSFGQAAAHYNSIRPSYPEAAVRWLLGPAAGGTVVDLGAGTGLLTRVIRTIDDTTVIPVEPDQLMREQLAASTAGLTPLAGSAENIPAPDGSVDGVVAGQAYHWFNREKAHAEAARVVRRGGVFGPIWNIRDETVEWVAEYTRIADDRQVERHDGWLVDPDFGSGFGPVERQIFHQNVPMTADRLVALLASRSYYLTATPERQQQLAAEVRALAETMPSTFDMPYATVCYRAIRA
jgi:SAM-dependent methyltransferase